MGYDLLLLSIGVYTYPTVTEDELAAFIANQGGDVYSRQAISSRLQDLALLRKVSSTEAYDAFSPRNQLLAEWFWTEPQLLGVVRVQTR